MEKIKKLLLSQTIKDTLISFLGLGFAAAVGFVYTVILARFLGPEQFGIFSALTALVAIVYSLGDLGIASALINFIPKFKDKKDEIVSTTFVFEFFVGLAVLILFVVFSLLHQSIIPGSLANQVLISGFLAFNYLLINYIQGIFTAERHFLRYSFTQIFDAGIKIAIIFLLLSTSRLSISSAILANVISTFFALIFTFGKQFIHIKLTFHKNLFSQIFSFAKWIAVTKVFSVFISRIDVILLNLLSNSFQAGIYAAANRITLLFSLLVSSLGSVVNPRFSSFDTKEKAISYTKKLVGLIALVSVSMLLCVVLARPIIEIVFGDKYNSAIPVFQVLTIAMIPFIFTLATTPAITYTFNQPRFMARMSALQVISIVVIELILIPSLGSFAPPIALGVSNTAVFIISCFKLSHLLRNYEV